MQQLDWGWCEKDGEYVPISSDKPAALKELLKVVRCYRKTGCSNRQCTCRANGFDSIYGCGVCRGARKNESEDAVLDVEE